MIGQTSGPTRVRLEWTAPNLIALVELQTPTFPARPSRDTHTHTQSSTQAHCLAVAVSRQKDVGRIDLGLSITASVRFYLTVTRQALPILYSVRHTTLSLAQQYTVGGSLSARYLARYTNSLIHVHVFICHCGLASLWPQNVPLSAIYLKFHYFS